jgi:hypothetical protein
MADDLSGFSDIERSRALLADSEASLRGIIDALNIMEARLRADETLSQADLAKALTVISQNRGRVSDDLRKHEDRLFFRHKQVANAPLDFDELRAAIGRKLDRLRAALDPGDVSEGA